MILLVGNGKLANSLEAGLNRTFQIIKVKDFSTISLETTKNLIIHAGSGRQIAECINYCSKTNSTLIELSTGIEIQKSESGFPLVICPNTAVLILKTLKMLKQYGNEFSKYSVEIVESHQASKTTVAGTAIELVDFFMKTPESIISIRDRQDQIQIGIPGKYLDLHAFHKIRIVDAGCEVEIQMKVTGHEAYINGVKELIEKLLHTELENRVYNIVELV